MTTFLRQALCGLLTLSFTCTALAESEPLRTYAPPPTNQYGAIDANAKIPLDQQILPPSPDDVQPTVISEAATWPELVPAEPALKAHSYILLSANTGETLAANNPNERLAPASLTKLMLLYIVEKELARGNISLGDTIDIPKVAWATGGSRMFLKPHDKVSLKDLVSGTVVQSGNDAAVALAMHVAGTQEAFVAMMNHEVKRLNMTNTHFNNVMGLPSPAHYSTAYDMALLGKAIVNDFPQYLDWYSQKSFTYGGIHQNTYNKLLFEYQYAIGLKTGSTDDSGYSVVSAARKPDRSTTLVGVVMGAPSRRSSMSSSKALLNFGFRFFDTQTLYHAGETLKNVRVYMGQTREIAVGTASDITATFPNANDQSLHAEIAMQKQIQAPVHKGDQLGTLSLKLQGKTLLEQPIIALEDDPKGSLWQRLKDKVALLFT